MPFGFFNYLARESIVYYPDGVTADAIECEGVVIRSPIDVLHHNLINQAEVWIPRGNLAGKVNSINVGKDEILMKVRPYTSPVRCRVTRLLTSDAYSWKLMVME